MEDARLGRNMCVCGQNKQTHKKVRTWWDRGRTETRAFMCIGACSHAIKLFSSPTRTRCIAQWQFPLIAMQEALRCATNAARGHSWSWWTVSLAASSTDPRRFLMLQSCMGLTITNIDYFINNTTTLWFRLETSSPHDHFSVLTLSISDLWRRCWREISAY